MVKGLDTFQKYFKDYEEQYVLIGGTACDILFESNEVNFRATRDLDMVLIIEASIWIKMRCVMQLIWNPFLHLLQTILCENKPGYAKRQKFTKAYKARNTKKN